jgi:hypothetical protein
VNCEVPCGCFRNPAHRTAEQIRQGPCPAAVCLESRSRPSLPPVPAPCRRKACLRQASIARMSSYEAGRPISHRELPQHLAPVRRQDPPA